MHVATMYLPDSVTSMPVMGSPNMGNRVLARLSSLLNSRISPFWEARASSPRPVVAPHENWFLTTYVLDSSSTRLSPGKRGSMRNSEFELCPINVLSPRHLGVLCLWDNVRAGRVLGNAPLVDDGAALEVHPVDVVQVIRVL